MEIELFCRLTPFWSGVYMADSSSPVRNLDVLVLTLGFLDFIGQTRDNSVSFGVILADKFGA